MIARVTKGIIHESEARIAWFHDDAGSFNRRVGIVNSFCDAQNQAVMNPPHVKKTVRDEKHNVTIHILSYRELTREETA